MEFAGVRADVEQFSAEQAREWYLLQSGQKETTALAAIYERYPHLCRLQQVQWVQAALAAAVEPEEKRRTQHYLQFFVRHYLGNLQKEKAEALHRARTDLTIQWGGREIPYNSAWVLLAEEADRTRRHELSRRLEEATAQHLNPLAADLIQDGQRLVRDLGYSNYLDLWEQVKGLDLAGLQAQCERFLAETAETARMALAEDLDRYLGLDLTEARDHDYSSLLRARYFDPHFTADALVPTLQQTLAAMGLDLSAQPYIRLDLQPRHSKSTRAFCSAIRIPAEVVLVMLPRGGQEDYQSLFHEAGHAEHFAHMDPALPLEFTRLGDTAVTEVYAFLLQNLLHDPLWLAEHLSLPAAVRHEYAQFARRRKLMQIRRYGGKLRYELQLYTGSQVAPLAAVYARELQAATFLPYREADFLTDLDPGLYAADYLRAWLAEAQLREHLTARFGRRWWDRPETGRFLRSLWSRGTRQNVVELVRTLGYNGLELRPLLADFAADWSA